MRSLLLLSLLLFSRLVFSQADSCIGTMHHQIGIDSVIATSPTPYSGFFEDGRTQVLYTKSELNDAGFYDGHLKEIAFYVVQKNSVLPFDGLTFKIGETPDSTFSDSAGVMVFTDSLTIVASPVSYTTDTGWNVHSFDSTYYWDGTNNLILELCFDNSTWTDNDWIWVYPHATDSQHLAKRQDGASGCILSSPVLNSVKPTIRLGVCDSVWTIPGVPEYMPSTVSIFPNPSTGMYSISGSVKGGVVYNSMGQQVATIRDNSIDLRGYPNGIYFAVITTARGSSNHKLVKH